MRPAHRTVLLGASNLRADLPRVLALAVSAGGAGARGAPGEILVAAGHGRSYGLPSRLAGVRSLPPILGCRLWDGLEARPPVPTGGARAVMADIGNDVAYGAPVERIAGWVATCSERLEAAGLEGDAVTLVGLPVASLERLGPARFALARWLLFPGRALERTRLLDAARSLDRGLRRLARERGHRWVAPESDWYGWDRIHLRRSRRRAAWGAILGMDDGGPGGGGGGVAERAELPPLWWLRVAEARWLWHRREVAQPAFRLSDGTAVELY